MQLLPLPSAPGASKPFGSQNDTVGSTLSVSIRCRAGSLVIEGAPQVARAMGRILVLWAAASDASQLEEMEVRVLVTQALSSQNTRLLRRKCQDNT